MSDCNSTGTVRGSEHPAVRELIADTISVWFGSREPDPDTRETISAEALGSMLHRVAGRAYAVGRADSEPGTADHDDDPDRIEDTAYRLDALLNSISALIRDRDFQFDDESCLRLLIMARELVARLLPAGADEP